MNIHICWVHIHICWLALGMFNIRGKSGAIGNGVGDFGCFSWKNEVLITNLFVKNAVLIMNLFAKKAVLITRLFVKNSVPITSLFLKKRGADRC